MENAQGTNGGCQILFCHLPSYVKGIHNFRLLLHGIFIPKLRHVIITLEFMALCKFCLNGTLNLVISIMSQAEGNCHY